MVIRGQGEVVQVPKDARRHHGLSIACHQPTHYACTSSVHLPFPHHHSSVATSVRAPRAGCTVWCGYHVASGVPHLPGVGRDALLYSLHTVVCTHYLKQYSCMCV